jgi:prophage regulatory protein
MRMLRIHEVEDRVGVTRSTIARWEKAGKFPARRQLGRGAIGWLETEINEWLQSLPRADSGNLTRLDIQ